MNLKLHVYIFLFMTFSVFGQSQFIARVSKTKLPLNHRLRVEFVYQGQGADHFKAPSFEGFKPMNSQPMMSTSQSISIINGDMTRKITMSYSYVLQPKQKGHLTIAPASINVDGKILQTKPINIEIIDAIKTPENPNDPNYLAEQNIHLVTHISNRNPYVGEAISVEYRLYTKNLSISSVSNYDQPKFEGFWSQNIDKDTQWHKGTLKGEEYEYAVLEKALLIPTRAGKLYVDALSLDAVVGVPVRRRNFFGEVFTTIGNRVEKSFSSAKQLINVQTLPNQPEGFTGAVGHFDYSVALSKRNLKANESSQIRVKVSGIGNLKSFKLPTVITPPELEVYTPERKEKTHVSSTGLQGYLSETHTIVPQYKGKYKIPSTSFIYFDPKDKKYHTIKTDELIVNVLEGKELPKQTQTVIKKDIVSAGSSFRYIKTTSDFSPIKKGYFIDTIWFYILLLLPLSVIPIVVLVNRRYQLRKGDIQGIKLRTANRLAKKYLSEAKKNLGNKQLFYESLELALHNYLKAKLSVETSDISREKITEILEEKGVNATTINNFIEVLKNCDFARYTPITDVEMQSEYENATTILTELDKEL